MTNEEMIKDIFKNHSRQPRVPVDEDLILRSRKETLIAIYKRNKKYTWFTAAAISILFAAKKAGITLSLTHCFIIAVAVPATLVTGITAGAVFTVHTLSRTEAPVSVPSASIPAPVAVPVPSVQCRIQMLKFRYDPLSADAASRLEAELFSEFSRLKGKGYASYDSTEFIESLTGSVLRTGEEYTVSVKLVDRNAQVILFRQAVIKNESEIRGFSRSIAGSIIRR